ncbi:hypothetical protein QZN26_21590, partial [Burkholderia multivorans]|nr:hypothetical protein [Burkholderia multivorans]
MSEVTVSPLPDRLRDRVAPTRASPLARRQARTRTARGVRRLASARTADAPLDRERHVCVRDPDATRANDVLEAGCMLLSRDTRAQAA